VPSYSRARRRLLQRIIKTPIHSLDKLKEWEFAAVENKPHGRVSVLPDGKFACNVYSVYYELSDKNKKDYRHNHILNNLSWI
jgi:hypothetical protein